MDGSNDGGAGAALSRGIVRTEAGDVDQACTAYSEAMDLGIGSATPDGLLTAALAARLLGAVMEEAGGSEEARHAYAIAEQLESANEPRGS